MKYAASVILLAMLSGCASTSYVNDRTHATQGALRGMVYDLDRLPVSQAKVSLVGRDQTVSTDVRGQFVLLDVPFGPVELTLEKPGYETYRWTLDYAEVSQVVYVQMSDSAQLFDAAVDALEQRQWDQARRFWERGVALAPDSSSGALIGALLLARTGKPAEAVAQLEAYLARFPRTPVLELALADLYEKDLKDPVRALKSLESAQALRYDPEVDLRLRKLSDATK